MVWTAAPDGCLDYVNGQGSKYFGVPQEALLGGGWLEGVHPAERERTLSLWNKSVATATAYETEYRLRRSSDGNWRWHLVRALPYWPRRKSNAVVRHLHRHRRPKTGRGELHQQWQIFDTALSNTPDFTYTFDLPGRFTYSIAALLSLWQNRSKKRAERISLSLATRRYLPVGSSFRFSKSLRRDSRCGIKHLSPGLRGRPATTITF